MIPIGLAPILLLILALILDYLVYSVEARPHHIRHRHFRDASDDLKPVPFTGRMTEIIDLSPEDRNRLLQGFHNYLVKHGKHAMGISEVVPLPGLADGRNPSTVVVPSKMNTDENPDAVFKERVEYSQKLANAMTDRQLERLNKVVTPQLDVLKKKSISDSSR